MDSHKKLIVPVIALLLCAVSIVGVGFAYQGSYTDAPVARDFDSYALEVDLGDNFRFDQTAIDVKFDTAKNKTAARTYTFNTTGDNPTELVDGEGLVVTSATAATFTETIKFKVTASEKPATGALTVDITLGAAVTGMTSFVSGEPTIAISDDGQFNLTANQSKEFTVTVVFTLDITVVTDDTVDKLVIPGFTVKATAATGQA